MKRGGRRSLTLEASKLVAGGRSAAQTTGAKPKPKPKCTPKRVPENLFDGLSFMAGTGSDPIQPAIPSPPGYGFVGKFNIIAEKAHARNVKSIFVY